MTTIQHELRPGVYYDSVVLMQLQRALLALDGVDTGVADVGQRWREGRADDVELRRWQVLYLGQQRLEARPAARMR